MAPTYNFKHAIFCLFHEYFISPDEKLQKLANWYKNRRVLIVAKILIISINDKSKNVVVVVFKKNKKSKTSSVNNLVSILY